LTLHFALICRSSFKLKYPELRAGWQLELRVDDAAWARIRTDNLLKHDENHPQK